MMFITGSKSIPPLGLPTQIQVNFKHGCGKGCRCKPFVSVCAPSITLPVHLETEEEMSQALIDAVRGSVGFDNV